MSEIKRIIIADDEHAQLLVLEQILNLFFKDIEILQAANGLEILDLINSHENIDLIIADVRMPKLDGFIVQDEIRKLKKDIPVLLLSGDPQVTMEEAKQSGAIDLLFKPYNRERMFEIIRSTLNIV